MSAIGDNKAMHRRVALTGMSGLAVGLLMGAGSGRLWHSRQEAIAVPEHSEKVELVREADHIFIPEGSPYRSRIHIAEVHAATATTSRALPAAVEADPAHTVNVLPPLGGRIVSLDVGLGDEVVAGQRLMSIDSGDLAQAYADDDKATAAIKMTRRALQRAQSVTGAGGGAMKDFEISPERLRPSRSGK